jgi:hypothetical protein
MLMQYSVAKGMLYKMANAIAIFMVTFPWGVSYPDLLGFPDQDPYAAPFPVPVIFYGQISNNYKKGTSKVPK